jgi:hypothetical protein
MANTTRWLKWNGVYTHAGVCNRKFAPVAEDLGVKERLMALGFNCSTQDKFESAIKQLKALLYPAGLKQQYDCAVEVSASNYRLQVLVDGQEVGTVEHAVDRFELPLDIGEHNLEVRAEELEDDDAEIPSYEI